MVKFWVLEPAYDGAGPEDSTRYLAVWDKGYLQPWNEWSQFLRPSRWNWITLSFAHIEAEYARYADYISFEAVILGLGFRLHHTIATEEELEASRVKIDEFWEEAGARSTTEDQLKELWAELPEDTKAQVNPDLVKRIELAISEPEEGKKKVIISAQALDMLGEAE